MKKLILKIIIFVVFFLGLSVMLYPTISDWYNKKVSSYVVSNYSSILDKTTNDEHENMMNEAKAYNRTLDVLSQNFVSGTIESEEYNNTLNVYNGMMCYIVIDKIKVNLPVFHGTDESVLQTAIGHLEGSHLPTGEIGNNTVLTGHTGLPTAELFTDLVEMEVGDTFKLCVLDDIFTYEVFAITIVEPAEVDLLQPVENKDIVTLVTCTPYGINSHRLLVQGEQISSEHLDHTSASQEDTVIEQTDISTVTNPLDIITLKHFIMIILGIIWILLLIIIIKIYLKKRKEDH